MPIKYVRGDLFKTDLKCIAHGCNTAGVMGSGVAAVVKKLHPETYKKYVKYCSPQVKYDDQEEEFLQTRSQRSAEILGSTLVTQEGDLTILNMMTQGDWNRAYGNGVRYASYDAIADCFKAANEHQSCRDGLGIPMIGAGLGGGDWGIIERIIEKSTPDIEVTVYQL